MADDAPIFVVVDDEPAAPRQPFAPLEVAAPAAAGRGAGGAAPLPPAPLAAAPHAWPAKGVGRASLDGTGEFDDIEPVRRAAGGERRSKHSGVRRRSRCRRRRRRAR